MGVGPRVSPTSCTLQRKGACTSDAVGDALKVTRRVSLSPRLVDRRQRMPTSKRPRDRGARLGGDYRTSGRLRLFPEPQPVGSEVDDRKPQLRAVGVGTEQAVCRGPVTTEAGVTIMRSCGQAC